MAIALKRAGIIVDAIIVNIPPPICWFASNFLFLSKVVDGDANFLTSSNFVIKNSTLQKFSYKASKPSTISYLSLEGVKVIEEIVFSNIEIHTLEISNCEINKLRPEAFDVTVTNFLKIQNNAFKEVESNAFKKLR